MVKLRLLPLSFLTKNTNDLHVLHVHVYRETENQYFHKSQQTHDGVIPNHYMLLDEPGIGRPTGDRAITAGDSKFKLNAWGFIGLNSTFFNNLH